jgi:hypothetical protein
MKEDIFSVRRIQNSGSLLERLLGKKSIPKTPINKNYNLI